MKKLVFLFTFCLLLVSMAWGQTTVFTDNFSSYQSASWTTSGLIGSSAWTVSRSGVDWGARRNTSPAQLELTNDASASANENGWVFANVATSGFSSPYNATLSSNTGLVTWSFNIRQIRSDPAGFGAINSYGAAFILATTSQTANNAGNGYAIVYGQSRSTDPIRLAKFSNGLSSVSEATNIITSNTTGLTDFGAQYISCKVTYNPTNDQWELFLRNDGTSAFADPQTGTLVSQGTATDNTYTSASLAYMGGYWQGSTGEDQTACFDNVLVSVSAGGAPSPLISVNGTLSSFSTTTGTASASQSYSVSGSNLTANISITAPSGFEVSTSENSGYQQSISLTQSGGSVASTTVYARLTGASAGNFSGNIAHESTDATTVNLSASGTVTDPTPIVTVNPSTLSGFTYVVDEGPSTHQTFTVSGSTLTADITVTASTNYEISEDGATYTSPITLTETDGSVDNTTIYVRLKAGLEADTYNSEVITASSTGADDKTVTCNGYVSSPPPPGYFVDFEGSGETTTGYASETVNLSGLDWDMTEAFIGDIAGDWKNGLKSARMRGYAASSMTMLEDVADGVGTVSFSYRRYGTDAQVDWKVEYSTDQGTSWTQLGSDFTAPDADDVQNFTEALDISDPVRIRIKRATVDSNTSNRRLNIDDISLSEYTPSYDITPDTPATYGNEGAETSITITGGGFVGANIISEGLTPAANAAFITSSAGILQLIGTGSVTLSFTPAAGDTWFTYSISGGDWVVIDLTDPDTVPIEIIVNLGSKDAAFEFKSGTGGNPTLPVELSTFTVALNNYNNAVLTWVTQTETGVSGFYVFRNTEESLATAEMVSSLIPATNTSQQQVYLFTDKELNGPGTYYYWLQVSDMDGSEGFHGPISLNYEQGGLQLPEIPKFTELKNVYPNPFNPSTTISYALANSQNVNFNIFNNRGQMVRSMELGNKAAGNHSFVWDGCDNYGRSVSTGVYFIRMQAGSESFSKKAVLMK